MEIEVYNDIMEDSDGTALWRHIEKSADNFNPFQRLTWARAWLANYNNVSSTFIFVARDGENAMVLPLMEYEGVLRTLCYNAADITGSISIGDTSLLAPSFADFLLSKTEYNKKLLWNVLPDDPLVKALKKDHNLELVERVPGHWLDIAGIRTDPVGWLNSSETRKQAYRDLRRLIRDGATLRYRVSPAAEDLDALMELHNREWGARGSSGKFADRRRRKFVKDLVADGFPVFISTMSIEKTTLAYNMHFYSDKTVSYWNSGYNTDFSQFGPGSALLVADILDIASATDYLSFDFLRGDEPYKHSYTNSKYEIHTYKI